MNAVTDAIALFGPLHPVAGQIPQFAGFAGLRVKLASRGGVDAEKSLDIPSRALPPCGPRQHNVVPKIASGQIHKRARSTRPKSDSKSLAAVPECRNRSRFSSLVVAEAKSRRGGVTVRPKNFQARIVNRLQPSHRPAPASFPLPVCYSEAGVETAPKGKVKARCD